MPKQTFDLVDYFGPLAAALIFATCLLIISFFFINFFLVLRSDEITVFEKMASKRNVRLGPHSLTSIKRRGHLKLNPDGEPENCDNSLPLHQIPQVKIDAASTS
ncbi:hypothetical protein M3Y94_00764400 [Aphelenchoides besseyi]|nr:hypothetical protein M3Y94_00764400 [Aphelenchoides besseyi]KAI6232207.1 hypothetical protein M3Y95_00462200 [Aphelenchoides besseyi]